MGENEQKFLVWQGSALAWMMLFWAGKGFPLTLTRAQPPCVMNHDASTVFVGIRNNTPLSLQSDKKNLQCIQQRLFQKESPFGFDFRGRSFSAAILLPCTVTWQYLLRESKQLWEVGRGSDAGGQPHICPC